MLNNGHSNVFDAKPYLTKSGESSNSEDLKVSKMSSGYRDMLVCIGEDPSREGLKRTPERAAKAMLYFTKGYTEDLSGKHTNLLFFF